MKVYFACTPGRQHIGILQKNEVKSLLFSYAFIKKPEKLVALLGDYRPERIILDSGAFSVWSNGGTVSLEAYSQFCEGFRALLPKEIELNIVNLDVLPGKWGFVPTKQEIADSAQKGWENMLYLESKGFKVIHVFHQHEDFEVLDRLMKHSDYIGISPANDVSMTEKLAWINKVFSITRDTIKTHGFAVTSSQQLLGYPFYSVDSSSWVSPARFGRVAVLDERYQVKTFQYKQKEDLEKFWKYVSDIGIDKIASPRWESRVQIAIKTYQKLERIATQIWTARGVVWK